MTAYDGADIGQRMRNHFSGRTEHLYGVLVQVLADDWDRGGVVREILAGHEDASPGDMVQLRLLAGIHRIVLRGDAPELAEFYPSAGGSAAPDVYAVWPALEPVLRSHVAELREGLDVAPQTNEVGRTVALLAGLSEALRRNGIRQIRLLEPGASAGLGLLVDRYRFVGDGWTAGPVDAPLVLDGCEAPGFVPEEFEVLERRGCDLAPFDATTGEGAAYLRSFIWPHMPERDARLRGALETLRGTPVTVDRAGGAEWVRDQVDRPAADDVLTVVWHSITRQYWPRAEYDAMLAAVDEARARMPLARVALEDPDPLPTEGWWRPQIEVDDDVIGWCTHHGPPLELAT
ncbi:DUF2332 domain-containing protein [Knoellia subterranea]|uniref:DUF2332 domain-containing protein n=1 Tax=Knoellia subterranea KCTC 19937 TaxID=1385521 RepID=A0A0A0JQG8_9MICO|nr:DUF2332 domain-containing protein [Knoellia subterranea]KGN39413.1 hypothetical protein N803_02850 [Knoellia subterranea KCTC 19937]